MTIDRPIDLLASAARLAQVMVGVEEPLRLPLLKRVARQQHEVGFPTFIKLLLIIEESDNTAAKIAIADTFAQALRCMDVPAGNLTAWGGSTLWQHGLQDTIFRVNTLTSTPSRRLDPIQYLVVWFSQKTQRPYLTDATFQYALSGLIRLINCNQSARELYPRKILSDLATASEGAYTRTTRNRLTDLANAWSEGLNPADIARAAAN